jgi:hemerythrin superfamily protein
VAEQRADTDVTDVLTIDHREALQLLHRIASSGDADERRGLADMVISEVSRHAAAEEMYVYPVMRKYLSDGEEVVEHDTQDHQQLEEIMRQLEATQPFEPLFDALVWEMTEKLRHHMHDDETDHFPRLREWAPREELVTLREKVESTKKPRRRARTQAYPHRELFSR